MTTNSFNFINYLAAKKSVDDRALNQQVLQNLARLLAAVDSQSPLHVLEIAAGIGTMLERLVDWDILGNAVYTAIDLNPVYTAEARHRLPLWAKANGFAVQQDTTNRLIFERDVSKGILRQAQDAHPESVEGCLTSDIEKIQRGRQQITVILETIDTFDFVAREKNSHRWDLLIAHAFLDLVDLSALLPPLFSLLKTDGLYYLTINFDGETILLPEIDPAMDVEIIKQYHHAMDKERLDGKPVGGSQSGRQLFKYLNAAGAQIVNAGSSDWVVFAGDDGYPHSEAFFLHCIINTIADTLQNQIPFDIAPWLEERHRQIDRGELVYIAHQLDFLGTVSR